jgi:hypothetical protein
MAIVSLKRIDEFKPKPMNHPVVKQIALEHKKVVRKKHERMMKAHA